MILEADGDAALTSAFPDKPDALLVKGRWRQVGSRVIVDFGKGESMVFDYVDDSLIARQWDRAAWGEAGPGTLYRESHLGRGLRG